MANLDENTRDLKLIGSIRPKRLLSLDNQRKLLHAFKCAVTIAATGFYQVFWLHITNNNQNSLTVEFLSNTVALFNLATYSLPHMVVSSYEFIAAAAVSTFASYLSFYILGHGNHSLYYGAFLLFAFVFFISASDRTKKHILYVKFAIVFFVVEGLLLPISTIHDFGLISLWVVIYGVLLGVGTSLFVTAVLCPLFPSQFIIPQMIDTIEEIRNMYSVCALYIKTASDPDIPEGGELARVAPIQADLKKREKILMRRVQVLNTYFAQAALDLGNKDKVASYNELRELTLRLYLSVLSMSRLLTKHDFFPLSLPLELLNPVNIEVLRYMDLLVDYASKIHNIAHHPPIPRAYDWPKPDEMQQAFTQISDAYNDLVFEMRASDTIYPSRPILRHAQLMVNIKGFIGMLLQTTAKLQPIRRHRIIDSYRVTPKSLVMASIFGLKNFWKDVGFGFIEEFKKKKSLKQRFSQYFHSQRWRLPLIFAITVTSIYPWAVFFSEPSRSERFYITTSNRSWFIITAAIVIMPAMGGTISRSVHRTIGTLLGANIGYLLGWAVLSAGGPHDASRWITLEFLFFGIMFIMAIIQQIPGTGYAALLATVTIFLVPGQIFHSTEPRPPTYFFISREVIILFSSLWASLVFTMLVPVKSVNNLEASLADGMTCAANAVVTMIHDGILDENGEPDCKLDEATRNEVASALRCHFTAQANYSILLQDTYWESWVLRKRYKYYKAACEQAHELHLSVASLIFAFGDGFSEEIKREIVVPTRQALQSVIAPLERQVREMLALKKAEANRTDKSVKIILQEHKERIQKQKHEEWMANVEKAPPIRFKQILEVLTEARKGWWSQRNSEAELPQDILHFFAFLSCAGRFVNEWEKMRQMVLHIKFRKQVGIEGLGNILMENLPLDPEEPILLGLSTAVSQFEKNQEDIILQEDKGGYFG